MTTFIRDKIAIKLMVPLIVIAGTCMWSPTELLSAESKTSSAQPSTYNRLIDESSPYLQQHVTNPINWFPWGEEAFEKAAKEDKPIFLSIGYSTCHWCHVMEHESFSDKEVAELLNKDFIAIKVDREERPDIDNVYMTVTQALTGSGGWPMTLFMTPDKKPFYAGTYFPKHQRWGRPGMMELLPKIAEAWKHDRQKVLTSADQITQHVVSLSRRTPGKKIDPEILDQARQFFTGAYDPEYGGFGKSPKFPSPHQLNFLLRRDHAKDLGISEDQLRKRLEASRQILFEARKKRIHPFKDDKILTDWNGLMIAALRRPFIPEKVVLFRPADKNNAGTISAIAPYTRSMATRDGQATAYVCQEFACKLPTTSVNQMLKNLKQDTGS